MAKLPKFMNPELHKALRNELSADGIIEENKKKKILQRMKSHFSKEDDGMLVILCNDFLNSKFACA